MAIPPLLHQPPDFSDNTPTMPPPLFTILFQVGIELRPDLSGCKVVSPWYFSSSRHLYFDMISVSRQISKRFRFKIELEPDLSTASLHAINTQLTTLEFDVFFEGYRICEDTLVSFWCYDDDDNVPHREVYTDSMSASFDTGNISSHSGSLTKMLLQDIGCPSRYYVLYPCPASGRFVRQDTNKSIVVLDFF